MWQITNITAKNFLSFKELNYNIVNDKLTTILGKNFDVSDKKSNGSGKSVLLDAITFAITGDTLRKLKTIKEVINNSSDNCETLIELENKALKKKLSIVRSIGVKQSQKAEIKLNDEVQDQLKDLHRRESDKFIEEQLGISFDDLINYYLISKFRYQSLFLTNDASKKEIINRFSKADIVDGVFAFIEADLEEIVNKKIALDSNLTKCQTTIDVYNQQIEDITSSDVEKEKQEKIEQLEMQITKKQDLIVTMQHKIKDINVEKISLNKSIENESDKLIDDKGLKKYDQAIQSKSALLDKQRLEYKNIREKYRDVFMALDEKEAEYNVAIKQQENDIQEYHNEIVELEKYVAGEIECPKCKHLFILADKDFDVKKAKKSIAELNKLQKQIEDEVKCDIALKQKVKKDKDGIEIKIDDEQKEIQRLAEKNKDELDELENQKRELINKNNETESTIHELKSEIQSKEQDIKLRKHQIDIERENIQQYKDNIKQEKDKTNKKEIDEIKQKISVQNNIRVVIEAEIEERNEKISELDEWEKKFKKFKSFLANTALDSIQQQSNYYLNKMKSDLMVSIDGFRELASGKLKDEITIDISRDGVNSESFGKFSGGERAICDLSSILAMQNIINNTSQSDGLNCLFIDEIIESLDAEGMNDVAKCLSELNQTIALISHSRPEAIIDCELLTIEKKCGVSKIIV